MTESSSPEKWSNILILKGYKFRLEYMVSIYMKAEISTSKAVKPSQLWLRQVRFPPLFPQNSHSNTRKLSPQILKTLTQTHDSFHPKSSKSRSNTRLLWPHFLITLTQTHESVNPISSKLSLKHTIAFTTIPQNSHSDTRYLSPQFLKTLTQTHDGFHCTSSNLLLTRQFSPPPHTA
jgi:hypothetical protein